MYPRPIIEELAASRPELAAPFLDPARSSIHVTSRQLAGATDFAVEDWILSRVDTSAEIKAYLTYLRRAKGQFDAVSQALGYWNQEASHSLGHDRWAVGWAGASLLSIAAYLYALRSYGVEGVVLECGVFKGSSTACLSLVCRELGYPLFAADSFEGLPSGEGHYGKGDFKGSRDEVCANVARLGAAEVVRYIQGWYSESLQGWQDKIALLWVDVDLQQSTLDVLNQVYPSLGPDAVIFSDGFTKDVDFDGDHIKQTGGEPAGFYRFFNDRGLNYKAKPGGAKGLALIVSQCAGNETILFAEEKFAYLTGRLEAPAGAQENPRGVHQISVS